MIVNPAVHFMGPKDCPFSFHGKNLVELRRAELASLAKTFKIPDGTKQEVLSKLVTRLRALQAPSELTELKSLE